MGPAIRVPWSAGFITTEATAALSVRNPDGEPLPACLVVQNNRITQGVVKGTLPTGLGQTGKGEATVGRNRCPRNVDRTCIDASRVVEGHHDLVRVIGV